MGYYIAKHRVIKHGEDTGRRISLIYADAKKYDEKFARLKEDYPESEGYRLELYSVTKTTYPV